MCMSIYPLKKFSPGLIFAGGGDGGKIFSTEISRCMVDVLCKCGEYVVEGIAMTFIDRDPREGLTARFLLGKGLRVVRTRLLTVHILVGTVDVQVHVPVLYIFHCATTYTVCSSKFSIAVGLP